MKKSPSKCPVCDETLTVTRLHCRSCDTTIEGQFSLRAFEQLTQEQLTFVETFVRCEGKLNRMEKETGLSYPTLRSRLTDLIRAMGYEVGQEESASSGVAALGQAAATPGAFKLGEDERRKVLDEIAAGRISSEQALKMLQGG
jgi:hypothetical protein